MDLRRVRAFRTIVEAGGLTRAAGLLHITPGALSKAMRQLEAEVGDALFAKDGRTLRLTDQGRTLYNASAALMEAHAATLRALDASTEAPARTLRLVTNEVFATYAMGALLDGALADHPASVLELHGGEMEQAIADHEADIGITYLPAPRPGLAYRPAGDVTFGVFTCAGPLAAAAFADLPFAIPTTRIDAAISDVLGIDCWPYERVPRTVKYRLRSLETALDLTRRGTMRGVRADVPDRAPQRGPLTRAPSRRARRPTRTRHDPKAGGRRSSRSRRRGNARRHSRRSVDEPSPTPAVDRGRRVSASRCAPRRWR